jgi:hypothetical protein
LIDDIACHDRRKAKECRESIEATKAKELPYPPSRPDPCSTDFFLFGCLKEELPDFDCPTREDLTSEIMATFNRVVEAGVLATS